MNNPCANCPYNAKLLHPKMPFGCFLNWCDGKPSSFDKTNPKTVHDEWIKNHPNWKGVPHIKYWFYIDEESFNEFLNKYPDVEHAPNDSWKDMYEVITLN